MLTKESLKKDSDRVVTPVKGIIPFPKSRGYVLWEHDDFVCIVRSHQDALNKPGRKKVEKLQALAVSPNEDFLVLVQKKQISLARLSTKVGGVEKIVELKDTCNVDDDTFDFGIRSGDQNSFHIFVGHKRGKEGKVEEIHVSVTQTTFAVRS